MYVANGTSKMTVSEPGRFSNSHLRSKVKVSNGDADADEEEDNDDGHKIRYLLISWSKSPVTI
jgi:hypothetical protein